MKRLRGWTLGLLLAGLALGSTDTGASPPCESAACAGVERLHVALLYAMKHADALGYAGRYERLAPVIEHVYDLPFMAEKVLGRHWRGLAEEDRARWVQTFTRLTIWTYADRFDGYSGERFAILKSDPWEPEGFLVRTHLVKSDGVPVELDYRVRQRNGHWRIIDVYLNGTVSELARRRSEYSTVVKRKGFASLVDALEAKIPQLAADASR